MSNVYYDGKRYYKLDEYGNRVYASARDRQDARYQDMVRKSTKGHRTSAKPRTVKVYVDRAKAAIAALCAVCIIVGGAVTSLGARTIDSMKENSILYEYSSDFRQNAISDNTKRTQNNKYYYYEYDDIHDYIARDGADYSQEVYLAYRNLGEHQMDRLFDEGVRGGPDSLQEFVEREGYETVDEWADAEREQLLLEHEMREKGYELKEMVDEVENSARDELGSYASSDSYGGK